MQSHPTEEWRAVGGYEGWYEVSDLGRIRRMPGHHGRRSRILNPAGRADWYAMVILYKDGRRSGHSLHRLVATAFHGPPPSPRHQVNHRDAVKRNCAAVNLEWVTPDKNIEHAREMRLFVAGTRHHAARFTDTDVITIRQAWSAGARQPELARLYGVSKATIQSIVHRRTWRHIPP